MTFKELNLSENILSAVESAGYDSPTPIQKAAIPPAIEGKDVLGIAQTGTGKTASFTIPMLTKLERGRARARMPRSLILAPTRELAAQVAESFEQLGKNHKLTIALLIGGVSFEEQFKKLDRGADVLIATPGRLMDHFSRGKVLLTGVEILVIDEADRMLDMGFIDDIKKICGLLPPKRQTMFFSATMPPEIQKFTQEFLKSPVKVEIERQSSTASTITQRFQFLNVDEKAKREEFRKAINEHEIENAIIFCNRKRDVEILYKSMSKHNYSVGALHGDMDQRQRMITLEKFRAGEITFLVASDVAARGLDIPNVGHVFNFDIPIHAEDYIHRIGRTGRAGRKGYAASLITPSDKKYLDAILELSKDTPVWIGEEPTNQDFKSRGRGNRGNKDRNQTGNRQSNRNTKNKNTDNSAEEKNKQDLASNANDRENTNTDQDKQKSTNNRKKTPARKSNTPKQHSKTGEAKNTTPPPPKKKTNEPILGMGDHVPAFMLRSVSKNKS
jgi:superfamily II DNA/RNA helicase